MDAFVTCIYNGLSNTPYGGRNARNERYRDSLLNIAATGAQIFCFTGANDYPNLSNYFKNITNIKFILKELNSLDIHPKIQDIKNKNKDKLTDMFWMQRCVEIMWGKFYMMQDILLDYPNFKNLYWIDAGLLHNDVFSPKYILDNKENLKGGGLPLFNPHLMQKLDEYLDDKLLILQHNNPHNKPIDRKYNLLPYKNHYGAVGGLFGGSLEKMKIVCSSFIDKMHKLLQDEVLCSEEGILSAVYCDHEELFKPYVFESWYHEGWAERYNPNLKSFSNFFDILLEKDTIEKDTIIFCTLAAGQRFRDSAKILIKTFLNYIDHNISLIIFTDDVNDFQISDRIIVKPIDVLGIDGAFHYGMKYKVVEETHRHFINTEMILYVDADCYFQHALTIDDFTQAKTGLNVHQGSYTDIVINPSIITKFNQISSIISLPKDQLNIRQLRECALLFKIENKYIFQKFLSEWQLLYEYVRDHKLAFSGEYIEITFAAMLAKFPINDLKGMDMITLRKALLTTVLNRPTQAIF